MTFWQCSFYTAWEQRKFEEFATYSGKKNKANLDLEPYAITSNEGFIKQNEAHNEFGYMKNTDRSAFAEFERDLIVSRTQEGKAWAKANNHIRKRTHSTSTDTHQYSRNKEKVNIGSHSF